MDDALAERPAPDAPPDPDVSAVAPATEPGPAAPAADAAAPATETVLPATATVAPSEVLLELPAPPSDLRPSLTARPAAVVPGPEPDGLDALDAPLLASASASLDSLRAEALRHLKQEGSWRLVLRALGVLLGVLLAFRLAFDAALPRLLLAAVGGAVGLAVLVLLLHHVNESRRQENLLAALTQLTFIARERPEQMPLLAPHLEALLASLRANASVWPSPRSPDALSRALSRALDGDAPPAP